MNTADTSWLSASVVTLLLCIGSMFYMWRGWRDTLKALKDLNDAWDRNVKEWDELVRDLQRKRREDAKKLDKYRALRYSIMQMRHSSSMQTALKGEMGEYKRGWYTAYWHLSDQLAGSAEEEAKP